MIGYNGEPLQPQHPLSACRTSLFTETYGRLQPNGDNGLIMSVTGTASSLDGAARSRTDVLHRLKTGRQPGMPRSPVGLSFTTSTVNR